MTQYSRSEYPGHGTKCRELSSGFPCVVYELELEIREMSTGGVLRLVFKRVLSFHRQKGGEIGARQDVAKSTG